LTATSNPFISGKPGFAEDFLDGVSESDLTLSVITLILAKAEKERDINGTLEKYLETWIDKNVETGKGLDVEEALIAALINEMIERGDDTSELKDLLVELLGITV
jgi:hypothetical protein